MVIAPAGLEPTPPRFRIWHTCHLCYGAMSNTLGGIRTHTRGNETPGHLPVMLQGHWLMRIDESAPGGSRNPIVGLRIRRPSVGLREQWKRAAGCPARERCAWFLIYHLQMSWKAPTGIEPANLPLTVRAHVHSCCGAGGDKAAMGVEPTFSRLRDGCISCHASRPVVERGVEGTRTPTQWMSWATTPYRSTALPLELRRHCWELLEITGGTGWSRTNITRASVAGFPVKLLFHG